jgi:hypothetical protein
MQGKPFQLELNFNWLPDNPKSEQPEQLPEKPLIIIQTYRCKKSDTRFRQRIKRERGLTCEKCGFATDEMPELSVHHILETRIYPQYAREPLNVLVLCQSCHSEITSNEQCAPVARIAWYAGLSQECRLPMLAFLEKAVPSSTALHDAFRRGGVEYWNYQAIKEATR